MRRPVCPRCGEDEPAVLVTQFGDTEERWLRTFPCDCPGPRCPWSNGRLDHAGRCADVDCFMLGQVVPVPLIA